MDAVLLVKVAHRSAPADRRHYRNLDFAGPLRKAQINEGTRAGRHRAVALPVRELFLPPRFGNAAYSVISRLAQLPRMPATRASASTNRGKHQRIVSDLAVMLRGHFENTGSQTNVRANQRSMSFRSHRPVHHFGLSMRAPRISKLGPCVNGVNERYTAFTESANGSTRACSRHITDRPVKSECFERWRATRKALGCLPVVDNYR